MPREFSLQELEDLRSAVVAKLENEQDVADCAADPDAHEAYINRLDDLLEHLSFRIDKEHDYITDIDITE